MTNIPHYQEYLKQVDECLHIRNNPDKAVVVCKTLSDTLQRYRQIRYNKHYFEAFYNNLYLTLKGYSTEFRIDEMQKAVNIYFDSQRQIALETLSNILDRLELITRTNDDEKFNQKIKHFLGVVNNHSFREYSEITDFQYKAKQILDEYNYAPASSTKTVAKDSSTKTVVAELGQHLHDAIDSWSSSFLRPLVPPKLMSNAAITRIEDDGAKLIYAKFLYGEQTGTFRTIPFDGSYGNVINDAGQESLWLYSLEHEQIPSGFESKSYDGGQIRTGEVQKCNTCRGQGQVTCKTCGGKVRWTEKSGDNYVDKVCSCGNGKQNCETCTGFGEMETVILVKKNFRVFETKNSQYRGEVPEEKIKKITGTSIFEHTIEYPVDEVKSMLIGGINVEEFNQLNSAVLEDIHDKINIELYDKGVNTKLIHEQINTLFNSVPNPGRENKLLQKEVMPIRVMLRVEDAPVTQVNYSFKEEDYSIWVYGNEHKVWYQSIPSSFNYKIKTLLAALLVVSLGWIYNSLTIDFSSITGLFSSGSSYTSQQETSYNNYSTNTAHSNQQQKNTSASIQTNTAVNNNPPALTKKNFTGEISNKKISLLLDVEGDNNFKGYYYFHASPSNRKSVKGKLATSKSINLIEYSASNDKVSEGILVLKNDCYSGYLKTGKKSLKTTICEKK